MTAVLDHPAPLRTAPAVDDAAARRSLREQIARLEAELGALVVSTWPRDGLRGTPGTRRGPRLLTLAELERLRDELAERLATARVAIDERGRREQEARRLREDMLLEPERHPWIRVSNEDVGEPGCLDWHVRPGFSVLGMLMGWWRVRISSGCP